MNDASTIESRLALLERDVANLKLRIERPSPANDWLGRIAGSMSAHPEFAQVLELGQELRRCDEPGQRGE
jgi:hypothetical protein